MASLQRAVRSHFTSPRRISGGARLFSTTLQRHETIPFVVSGQGAGVAQSVQVKNSKHRIEADAFPTFGGKDAAPSPLHYNLTSLSTCTQVTGSLVAKDLGINLKQWKVSVGGELDPSVLVKGVDGNANWNSIELNVEVETDADQAKFDQFASETERRCPITQLFKRSGVEWTSKWANKS